MTDPNPRPPSAPGVPKAANAPGTPRPATGPHVADRLVFAHAVESLFVRGLSGRITPQGKARLRELGLDLDRALLPAYSADCYSAAVAVAASDCFPALAPAEAYFNLGERTVLGLTETMIGRAAFALARVIGPYRTLMGLSKNIRGASNYSDSTAERLGPTDVRLRMTGYALPHGDYMRGSICGIFTSLYVTNGRAEIEEFAPAEERVVIRASW